MLVNESTMEVADVYKGDARVGKPVGAYVQPHWGNNQMWRWNVNVREVLEKKKDLLEDERKKKKPHQTLFKYK